MTAPTPDLKAIRSRSEAATAGPWLYADDTVDSNGHITSANVLPVEDGITNPWQVVACWGGPAETSHQRSTQASADAAFVAASRKDIPDLLDALAVVAAERDRERAQHEATKSTLDKAWGDLHAEKQMREETRVLLDQALTERDQARQMLADAPHADDCTFLTYEPGSCSCWKAGL